MRKFFLFSFLVLFVVCLSTPQSVIIKPTPPYNFNFYPDFSITELYSIQHSGKRYLRVKVKNSGITYKGYLMFKIQYLGPTLSGNISVSKNVNFQGGKTIKIDLIQMPNRISCLGEKVKVTVDPLNKIKESNENNNTVQGKVFRFNTFDGMIEYVRVAGTNKIVTRSTSPSRRILKIHPFDIAHRVLDEVWIPFEIGVRNCGRTYINGATIKAYVYYESECESTRSFRYLTHSTSIQNFSGEGREISMRLTLPLYTKTKDNKKFCFKLDKLMVKLFYDTGETERSRVWNNTFVFSIEYTKDPKYYTK